MSKGLRPHYHQWYIYDINRYFDKEKGCGIKNATYRCMICGREYHERYEYKPPPKKYKSCKVLQKNKKKYSNHK